MWFLVFLTWTGCPLRPLVLSMPVVVALGTKKTTNHNASQVGRNWFLMPKDFTNKNGYHSWIVNLCESTSVVNVIRNQLFLHPVGGFRLPAPLWSYPRRQRQRALRLTVQCPVKLHRRNGHENYHTTWKKHICLFFWGQAFEVALSLGSSNIFPTLSLKIRIWKIVASKFCSARQVWTTWNTTSK